MKTHLRRITFLLMFLLIYTAVGAQGLFVDEDAWVRYTSLSFALPFTSYDYDTDAADGTTEELVPIDFDSTTYTFDYQAHHISPKKGFTVLTRWGFGGWRGDYELSDGTIIVVEPEEDEVVDEEEGEGEEEEPEEKVKTFKLTDNTGFVVYFNLGFGRAFEFAEKRILILPTAGIGLNMYMLSKTEGSYPVEVDEESEGDSDTQESFSYTAIDFSLNIFLNVTVAFMFNEKYGLSISCQMSRPAFGIGISRTSTDSKDTNSMVILDSFGDINFMPAVGLCIHL